MQTIITFPACEGHEEQVAAIEAHTVGAKTLESYRTLTGARLLFAMSRDDLYLTYIYGSGYHRLSVTADKGEAQRLLELMKEHHGIASESIG